MKSFLVIALICICFLAILGTLFGLQQIVTQQAQIILDDYQAKKQISDSVEIILKPQLDNVQLTVINNCTSETFVFTENYFTRIINSKSLTEGQEIDIGINAKKVNLCSKQIKEIEAKGIDLQFTADYWKSVEKTKFMYDQVCKLTEKFCNIDFSGDLGMIDSLTQCMPSDDCIIEKITKIVDGDTIYTENYKIRLSLTNTPEKNQPGFNEATLFTANLCPVGTMITINQDDLQKYDKYGRLLGEVFCGDKLLNSELLYNGLANIMTRYCSTSEFSKEPWAIEFGCGTDTTPK